MTGVPHTPVILDTSSRVIDPIQEDTPNSLLRDQSASPEAYSERSDYFDFADSQRGPQRRSTHPPLPSGSPDEHKRSLLGRSSTSSTGAPNRKIQTLPPKAPNRIQCADKPGPNARRHSTVDTKNSASFEETAAWDRKAVLSLDGGGIRGYSALLILQDLMRSIGRLEKDASKHPPGTYEADGPAESSYHPLQPIQRLPTDAMTPKNRKSAKSMETVSSPWLPCHYFDYMAGTSTGGLISIMLGRLRMPIDDCIEEYESLGAKVFGKSRLFHMRGPLLWPRHKYNCRILQDVVRDVVNRRVPKVASFPGGTNFSVDENRCRTVVVAFQQQTLAGVEKPYLFRTYKNLHKSTDPKERPLDRNPDLAHDIPIWQVARATSAAPTYFKAIVIDGLEYVDGGFGANNPCEEIYEEVRKMNNNSEKCLGIVLSVGTGRNIEMRRFKGTGFSRYFNYLNFARKWASDSEGTHLAMLRKKKACKIQFDYYRLNVEEGLGQMKLDEWRARGRLRQKIGQCIGKLRKSSRGSEASNGNVSPDRQSHGAWNNATQETFTDSRRETSRSRLPSSIHTQKTPTTLNYEESGQTDTILIAEGKESGLANRLEEDSGERSSDSNQSHSEKAQRTASEGHYPSVENIPKMFLPRNKTLELIRSHTEEYLRRPDVRQWIEECAEKLVQGRRDRAKSDPQRWEKACFGAWYQCNIGDCPRGEKEYDGRRAIKKHMLDKHRDIFSRGIDGNEKLEAALDACKIVVH